jgi:hypothetical protein
MCDVTDVVQFFYEKIDTVLTSKVAENITAQSH